MAGGAAATARHGLELGYSDRLRDGVREVLAAAARGAHGEVGIGRLARGLHRAEGLDAGRRAYHCVENHDLVLDMDGHRTPRIARLADGTDSRSWYARSRSRVATGLLLTAPGVPMLFLGQEFLEDKLWSDSPGRTDLLIWWDGAFGADRHRADFLRFTRDLTALRRAQPGLRGEGLTVLAPDERDRVIAFQRWVPGQGYDVIVALPLSESTLTRRTGCWSSRVGRGVRLPRSDFAGRGRMVAWTISRWPARPRRPVRRRRCGTSRPSPTCRASANPTVRW